MEGVTVTHYAHTGQLAANLKRARDRLGKEMGGKDEDNSGAEAGRGQRSPSPASPLGFNSEDRLSCMPCREMAPWPWHGAEGWLAEGG